MKEALIFIVLSLFTQNVHTNFQHLNDIPPRLQWNENEGYCGEVSLISAGLYYGQYGSQFDMRAIAGKGKAQNKCQLLLGVDDEYTAGQLRLSKTAWNTNTNNGQLFLKWVKQNVLNGYPVAIGIYMNQNLFYGTSNANAGDPDYDHIVPVYGISSAYPFTDTNYHGDDVIWFSDNGLWSPSHRPLYQFNYTFDGFQANRRQANAKNGNIYSMPVGPGNYGLSVTGVVDANRDCLPVRIQTNVNYEQPEIAENSNTRPTAMSLSLTITVSNLQPNVAYNLYRYNSTQAVPQSSFNAAAASAAAHWRIQITFGSTYSMTETIQSSAFAIYRAVKASAA